MVQSYDRLGLTQLRDDTKRVLEKSYPNTPYLYPERATTKKSWWKFW
jgi:outer membrane protein assembly factor BamD